MPRPSPPRSPKSSNPKSGRTSSSAPKRPLREGSPNRTRSRPPERDREQAQERVQEQMPDRTRSRPPARVQEQPKDRSHDRADFDHAPLNRKVNGIWLFGLHAVAAALNNPLRKIQRFVTTTEGLASITPMVQTLPTPQVMERADMARLLPSGAVHQGAAILTSALPPPNLDECLEALAEQDNALLLVLDQITDPHNVGAIIRSAAAFGAKAILTQDRHSPDETGTLAKSASGALERLPLVRVVNIVQALDTLKKAGFWIAGLAGEAERTLAETKLSGKIVLVLGAEGPGLRRLTREHCDLLVRLPITDAVESLNVSNAAAIALYELVRQ